MQVRLGVTIVLDLHYMVFLRGSNHMTRYLTTFLKAVELRFSDMTNPKISLILTGIIEMDASTQAKIYDENSILLNRVDGSWTRGYLRKVRNIFPIDKDVILILTGFNLWAVGDSLGGNITNSADNRGACTTSNIALCEDDGLRFSGVGSAAQAIAQLLGARHDSSSATNANCLERRGYLLSSWTGMSDHYNLSACGKAQIANKLKSDKQRRECMLREPIVEESMRGMQRSQELPYDFFNDTNPCNLFYGLPSCE
ncbi:unnamed protein product, partial [Ixodes hexagonus]